MDIINKINEEIKESIISEKTEKIENKEVIPDFLTKEQEQKILDWWNNAPKDSSLLLKDAVQAAFGPGIDGRDKRAKLVKQFLATREIKAKSTFGGYEPIKVDLSIEQKEFITNNVSKMTPFEMAKILFPDVKVSARHKEFIVVNQFVGTLQNTIKYKAPNEAREGKYRPPKDLTQAVNVVNQFIRNGIEIEAAKKDKRIQECLNGLIGFCHTPRFILLMDTFIGDMEKNLFESSFIRYCYNKPDLSEEEVDSYVNLCLLIVNYTKMQSELETLCRMRDETLDETEGKKMAMSMVDQINGVREEMDRNQKMQSKLLENLVGKRNERLDIKTKENQSVLQLVEAWRDDEKRKRLLKLANKRKEIVKTEVERLENMDTFIGEIFGLDKDSF